MYAKPILPQKTKNPRNILLIILIEFPIFFLLHVVCITIVWGVKIL